MIKNTFLLANAILTVSGAVSFFGGSFDYSTISDWLQWAFSEYTTRECFIPNRGTYVSSLTLETYIKLYVALSIFMNSMLLICFYILKVFEEKEGIKVVFLGGWLIGSIGAVLFLILSLLPPLVVIEMTACEEGGIPLPSLVPATVTLIVSFILHSLYVLILSAAFFVDVREHLFRWRDRPSD